MRKREDALAYALTLPDSYQDAPFHDLNWQLVRYKPTSVFMRNTAKREWLRQFFIMSKFMFF